MIRALHNVDEIIYPGTMCLHGLPQSLLLHAAQPFASKASVLL